MIKWIIFDAMGVVFTVGDDTNDLLVPFVRERNGHIPTSLISETYLQASLGKITSRQFWGKIGLGAQYPAVETEYLDTRLSIDNEFVVIAKKLRLRYSIGLLSNDVSEWSRYLREKFALDFLDTVIISADVQCRKPALRIYERFLNQAQTNAKECVFIDDRYKNLSAARMLGLRTIHFARETTVGNFVPDATIRSFSELENAIESIGPQNDAAKRHNCPSDD